jgi:addiction module HigA family antidote
MSTKTHDEDDRLPVPHPGEFVIEIIDEIGLSPQELSARTQIPLRTVSAILRGKADITPDVARRFGRLFHQSMEYWLNLQKFYDERTGSVSNIVPLDIPEWHAALLMEEE